MALRARMPIVPSTRPRVPPGRKQVPDLGRRNDLVAETALRFKAAPQDFLLSHCDRQFGAIASRKTE